MPKKAGMITPRKYFKIIERRRKLAKFWGNLRGVPIVLGGIGGAGISIKLGPGFFRQMSPIIGGMAAGWLAMIIFDKHAQKLELQTLLEIKGRPKLAEKLATHYGKKDHFFAEAIREWAKGEKLSREQREELCKKIIKKEPHD